MYPYPLEISAEILTDDMLWWWYYLHSNIEEERSGGYTWNKWAMTWSLLNPGHKYLDSSIHFLICVIFSIIKVRETHLYIKMPSADSPKAQPCWSGRIPHVLSDVTTMKPCQRTGGDDWLPSLVASMLPPPLISQSLCPSPWASSTTVPLGLLPDISQNLLLTWVLGTELLGATWPYYGFISPHPVPFPQMKTSGNTLGVAASIEVTR